MNSIYMWKDGRKVLVILIVIFVIANLALFTYLFFTTKKPLTQKKSPSETGYVSPSNPNIGTFSVRKGDLSRIILGGLNIFGYIESSPIKDEKGNETFTLTIPLKNGKNFKSEVVLGKEGDKISHTFIKTGATGVNKKWSFETVKNLNKYIEKGRPVMLELFYQQSIEGLSSSNCDAECRLWVIDKVSLFENNLRLLKALEENNPLLTKVQIGPVKSVIFYVDK